MLSNRLLLLTLIIVVVSVSCIKNTVEPGVETTIRGIIQDDKLQKPIPGVRIEITESRRQSLFGGGSYYKVIDSTISGPDGKYKMTFKTTGRGNQYNIHLALARKFICTSPSQDFTPGGTKDITFNVFEVHTLKALLQIVNNPRPPLWVGSLATGGFQYAINGVNKDTTVYLMVRPNQENYVFFYIHSPPDSALYYNTRIDTIFLAGFADTFSRSFQLDPRTFPRR